MKGMEIHDQHMNMYYYYLLLIWGQCLLPIFFIMISFLRLILKMITIMRLKLKKSYKNEKIKSYVVKNNLKNLKGFIRFENFKGENGGSKLSLLEGSLNPCKIIHYIDSKISKFVYHSNDTKRNYIPWKNWSNIQCSTIELSENLSLPIYKEPQSMYWVRKQVSIYASFAKYNDGIDECKSYIGDVSEDRNHDLVFISNSIKDTFTIIPVQDTLILRSDKASNFKFVEAFVDLQRICNETNINIMRVYGSQGHG